MPKHTFRSKLMFPVVKSIPRPVRRRKFVLCIFLEKDVRVSDARKVFRFFHNCAIECGSVDLGFGKLFWKAGSWLAENIPTELEDINDNTRTLAFTTFSTSAKEKVCQWVEEMFGQCTKDISGTLTHKIVVS